MYRSINRGGITPSKRRPTLNTPKTASSITQTPPSRTIERELFDEFGETLDEAGDQTSESEVKTTQASAFPPFWLRGKVPLSITSTFGLHHFEHSYLCLIGKVRTGRRRLRDELRTPKIDSWFRAKTARERVTQQP